MTIGLLWALRLATGRTPLEAYVRAWANGCRKGKGGGEARA